jgi:hypothetical protein
MTELKERFSLADEIDTRDLWDEARLRAAAPSRPALHGVEASGMPRWRRLGTAMVAIAVFVAAALFAWEAFHGDVRPRPGPATERPPVDLAEDPAPFVPATEMGGDEIRMPVTFPDGSTGTLVYPRQLALAEMGVQPDVTYSFRERYQGPIVFLHDRDASIRSFVERTEPVAIINSDRRIEIWAARGNDVGARFWMRVSLPSWIVLVPLEEQGLAEQVATSLDVRETADGFPVVEASGSAALGEGFGEAGGAQLAFGDALAAPDMVSQLDAIIFLSPDGCSPTAEGPPYGGYGSSCLGGGNVFASIYGIHGFVPSVIEGLRVEDFRQA